MKQSTKASDKKLEQNSDTQRFGSVILLGRPNAGKSTLINAVCGEKLAAVSRRPETTQKNILGVCNHRQTQFAFYDCPGLTTTTGVGARPDSGARYLNRALKDQIREASLGASLEGELILYLMDVTRLTQDLLPKIDRSNLEMLLSFPGPPIILCLSKRDRLKLHVGKEVLKNFRNEIKEAFLSHPNPDIQKEAQERLLIKKTQLFSSKDPSSYKALLETIAPLMPLQEGDDLAYPEGTPLDLNSVFSELIHEQLFRTLGQELPYSCQLSLDHWDQTEAKDGAPLYRITATIHTQEKRHKSMLIGAKGQKIKEIGQNARQEILRFLKKHSAVSGENTLEPKVLLDVEVR